MDDSWQRTVRGSSPVPVFPRCPAEVEAQGWVDQVLGPGVRVLKRPK